MKAVSAASGTRRRPLSRRSLLLPIHRWVGLTLGLVAAASAVTGAGLVFRKQLDPLVYPDLLRGSACASRLPLDTFVARARALHPKRQVDYVRLLARADAPVIVRFDDKDTYYFDGCTGAVLGEQNRYRGVFGRLEQIHRFVFIRNGGWLMGAGALALAFGLVAGGLTVWWPKAPRRLRDVLRPNFALRGRAWEIDLHRTAGAWLAIPLFISATTALPQAFDWVRRGIDAVVGTQVEPPPRSAPPGRGARKITLERAWREVQFLSPHPREALLHLPMRPTSPVEVFLIAADAPHANARTYVDLDAYDGRVLRFTPYRGMGLGEKIYFWTLSIHTGEVGGLLGQFLLFLGALGAPALAFTGLDSYLRGLRGGRPIAPGAPLSASSSTIRLARVEAIREEAPGIKSFRLVPADGRPLPETTPGAHIDVRPPSGVTRQYSLCNGPDDSDHYLIAVRRDSASRGGSRAMHDSVKVGDILPIGEPRNHFPLREGASHLLLARGIGVTPILAMAKTLAASGDDFRLEYFTRAPENTPFRDQLVAPGLAQHVRFHFGLDEASQADMLQELLASRRPGAHLYVCGGRRFMEMAAEAAAGWPAESVHREYFSADPRAWAGEHRGFDVRLARRGVTVHVPPELSLAEALTRAGVPIETSCEQGVCGTCLAKVLQGKPDHRDAVLTPLERELGDRIALCVSRSVGPELVLDL